MSARVSVCVFWGVNFHRFLCVHVVVGRALSGRDVGVLVKETHRTDDCVMVTVYHRSSQDPAHPATLLLRSSSTAPLTFSFPLETPLPLCCHCAAIVLPPCCHRGVSQVPVLTPSSSLLLSLAQFAYEMSTNSWKQLATLPWGWYAFWASELLWFGGNLVLVGGKVGDIFTDNMWLLRYALIRGHVDQRDAALDCLDSLFTAYLCCG